MLGLAASILGIDRVTPHREMRSDGISVPIIDNGTG
jgi:hypothetical protein